MDTRTESESVISYHDKLQEGLKTFSSKLRSIEHFPENFFVELYQEIPNSFGKIVSKILQVKITCNYYPGFYTEEENATKPDDESNAYIAGRMKAIFDLFCNAAYKKYIGEPYYSELNKISGIMKKILKITRKYKRRDSFNEFLKNPQINIFRVHRSEINLIEDKFAINKQDNFSDLES